MKVILSNKAFFEPDEKLKERIKTNLTYKVRPKNAMQLQDVVVHNFGPYVGKQVWIPNTRLDLLYGYDYEVIDKRVISRTSIPTKLRMTLRPDQKEVVDQVDDSCIINASPGWGKTYATLGIIDKLQCRALIVCPNKGILEMWKKTIQEAYGFTPGMVTKGTYNINMPITIANIQAAHLHIGRLANHFGILVIDEMHHCPANTFRDLIFASRARYKIGLSGTLSRPDGLDTSFKDYFGFKIFTPKNNNIMKPTGHIWTLNNIELSGTRRVSWGEKMNRLAYASEFPAYATTITKLYKHLGHKILVVGDRVPMLREIAHKLGFGLITGSTPVEERNEILRLVTIGKLQGICATTSIFSEGISQNNLSCLVIATAIGNNEALVEQLAGRIMRKHPDKLDPVIVDISIAGTLGKKQRQSRQNIYKQKGWDYKFMTVEKLMKGES